MKRHLGVCPKCFGANIEPCPGVLRRCRDCGKYFGQSVKAGGRGRWAEDVPLGPRLRLVRQGG